MADSEDNVPTQYKYSWSKDSELSLDEFLTKFRPSMVQDDGKKPWIWVRKGEPSKEDQNVDEAITEATELLNELTEKVESIKNDASIPVRSNKKTGARSKKELREEEQALTTERLKAVAIKHGYVSGKWLIFAPADKIDAIWRSVASSLVDGPLSSTDAYLAKVATSPAQESPNYQHIICIYMPDVYDKKGVTEVMRVLLRNHGATLSGVKSNLYTSIGIDSKHASGIQSTVWKNTALMKDSEIQELKDAFFSALASKPEVVAKPHSSVANQTDANDTTSSKSKPKLKLKKKVDDDPFASDDENTKEKPSEPKTEKPASKRNAKGIASGDDSEAERKPAKKRKTVRASKENCEDDSDESSNVDDRRSKKRRTIKK